MEENNNNGFEMNSNMNQSSTTVNKPKKSKVIPILVFIIVILILLLALCMGNMYALTNDYDNVFAMVASMVSGKEVVNEEENANLDQPIKDEEDEIINTEEFSEETIKKTLQNYLDLVGANGISTGLVLQKLQLIDDYKKLTEITEDYYVKTNVLYSTYKETMLNYVSEECFNKIFSSELLHKEIDGILYYFDGGESSGWISSEVVRLKSLDNGYYLAEYYDDNHNGGKTLETIEFNVANYNGKCVFNTEKISETAKLTDEKVKEVLQNYLDLMDAYEGTPAHLLYRLELMTKQEFNKILESNTYCKTDIKFSEYKEAMLNYVSESWFNEKFAKLYNKSSDENEYLQFQHLGASIGTNKVESITLKENQSESNYAAQLYNISSDGVKGDTYSIEFSVESFTENGNEKIVISYCDELKY